MNPRITVYIHVSCPSGQPWAVQIRIQSNLVRCTSSGLQTIHTQNHSRLFAFICG